MFLSLAHNVMASRSTPATPIVSLLFESQTLKLCEVFPPRFLGPKLRGGHTFTFPGPWAIPSSRFGKASRQSSLVSVHPRLEGPLNARVFFLTSCHADALQEQGYDRAL